MLPLPNFRKALPSKVQNRTWKQSVPSAVADGSPSRNAKLLLNYEYDRFTHPLPRTVLTVSKRNVLTFEGRPFRKFSRVVAELQPWAEISQRLWCY
jgi:hypothetical protein